MPRGSAGIWLRLLLVPQAMNWSAIKKILSRNPNVYGVGSHNESTRAAWLKQVLGELLPAERLLDAGAGECQYRNYCSHLNYVSQDIAIYDGKGDGAGLQIGSWDTSHIEIVSDITSIPEPAESFDAILCTEVLEHLPEPTLALKEFARLLRPGGTLIITAPFCSLTHFAPSHFSTGFNRYFYIHHLEQLGFKVTDLVENGNFFEFLAQELRRTPSVAGQYCADDMGRLEHYAIQIVLAMLERFSARDRGSKELLHFDYQVRAIKEVV